MLASRLIWKWKRRSEPRVWLLLAVGLTSVVILIPYARADHEKVTHLNDISEDSGILTFLIQVTIVGRDLNKKIKFQTVLIMTVIAEVLVFVDCVFVALTIHDAFMPDEVDHDALVVMNNINLVFVVVFRFYCIAAANGWRDIVLNRRLELLCYVLFATDDLPFLLLNYVSGLDWDAPQALYNRLTIIACLVVVTRSKIRKDSSENRSQYHHSQRPLQSSGSMLRLMTTRQPSGTSIFLRTNATRASHVCAVAQAKPRTASMEK